MLSDPNVKKIVPKVGNRYQAALAIAKRARDIEKRRVHKVVTISTDINSIITLARSQNFVPVVDDRGMFMGIITRKSVMQYYSKKYLESPIA